MSTDAAGTLASPSDRSTARSSLGLGLAHRARTQTVLAQHWSAAGVVGAVGRASVGFGLAVGRSRAIRPTVRFADLNSAALRPSMHAWRPDHADRGDDPVLRPDGSGEPMSVERTPDVVSGRAVPTADPAVGATSSPPTPQSRTDPRRRAPAVPVRRRRHVSAGRRPTWTDQVIQRSAIGYTTPPVQRPVDAIPADFVPSGDPKVDRLRLLLQRRDELAQGAAPTSRGGAPAQSPGRRATGPSPRSAVSTTWPPDDSIEATGGRRGDTAAGRATGPGQFARSIRPESVGPDVGTATARRVSASTPAPGAPVPSPSRPSSTAGGSNNARRQPGGPGRRRGTPDKAETLRAALIERGLLEAPPATAPQPGDRSTDRPTDPAGVAPRPAGDRGASSDASSRTQRAESAASGADASLGAPRSTETSASLRRAVQERAAEQLASSGDHATARPPAPRRGDAAAPIRSASSGDDGARRPSATPDGGAPTGEIASAVPPMSPGRPSMTQARQDLRAQRTLSTGLAPADDEVARRRTDGATIVRDVATPGPAPTDAPSASASLALAVAPPPPINRWVNRWDDRSTHRSSGLARPVPALPGQVAAQLSAAQLNADHEAATDVAVVRRVTLPRAFSATHRPVTALSRPTVLPSPTLAPRASSVTLRHASEPAPPGPARRNTEVRTGVNEDRSVDGQRARAGSGALLDVVRRTPTAPSERRATDDVVERPAERVAAQFMTELSRTVRDRPTLLPAPFRPLADAIAGPRPVMLSTDTASRRALRSVGKVAATTGHTIHLDRSAIPGARLNEVMAHELTHVAAPSPTPRFFDDLDDSPEERRAEKVGRLMASSPLAPSASIVPPAARSRQDAVRRSPVATSPLRADGGPGSGPGSGPRSGPGSTVSADALVEQLSGSGGGGDATIRRAVVMGGHRTKPPAAPAPNQIAPPSPQPVQPAPDPNRAPPSGYSLSDDAAAPEWFEEQLQAHLQPLLRMIEDRMIVELERRGGRTWRMT